MNPLVFDHFFSATKLAYSEPPPRTPPEPYEKMDKHKWKQTAIDLPVVVGSAAAGYGISKTIADRIAEKSLKAGKPIPAIIARNMPMITSGLTAAGGYMAGRVRGGLKERREDASQRVREKTSSNLITRMLAGASLGAGIGAGYHGYKELTPAIAGGPPLIRAQALDNAGLDPWLSGGSRVPGDLDSRIALSERWRKALGEVGTRRRGRLVDLEIPTTARDAAGRVAPIRIQGDAQRYDLIAEARKAADQLGYGELDLDRMEPVSKRVLAEARKPWYARGGKIAAHQTKEGASRLDREIAAGRLQYADVDPRIPRGEVPGLLQPAVKRKEREKSSARKDDQRRDVGLGVLGVGGGGLALAKASPLATGRSTYYHGTAPELADKIRREGLRPSRDSGVKGVTDLILGDEVAKKPLVYAHPNKIQAKYYQEQAKALQRGRESFFEFRLKDPLHVLHADDKGVVKLRLPYAEYAPKFVQNPETAGGLAESLRRGIDPLTHYDLDQVTKTIRDGVAPEHVVGGSKFKRLSFKEVANYARKYPKRFGAGAGLSLVGLGGLGLGAHRLYRSTQRHKEAAAVGSLVKGVKSIGQKAVSAIKRPVSGISAATPPPRPPALAPAGTPVHKMTPSQLQAADALTRNFQPKPIPAFNRAQPTYQPQGIQTKQRPAMNLALDPAEQQRMRMWQMTGDPSYAPRGTGGYLPIGSSAQAQAATGG